MHSILKSSLNNLALTGALIVSTMSLIARKNNVTDWAVLCWILFSMENVLDKVFDTQLYNIQMCKIQI